tara:strand:+ start:65 stop:259 length:195 start_codon:yes stop_codon:yes gene_type:complete
METRLIDLPQGATLEVSIKPEFLEKVKAHYNLETIQDVNDDHIRRFIHNVFSTAVDKGYAEVVS